MRKYLLIFGLLLLTSVLWAQTGLDIIRMAENRPSPESSLAEMEMRLKNSRGQERVRSMEMAEGDFGGLQYSLIRFTAPSDVRGVGLLSIEQENDEDLQWLYMPALKRSRRISSSGKSDSFMGSDFTYEDLENTAPDKGQHTKIGTDVVNGRQCWVVETVPEDRAYSRVVQWIGQESKISWKAEFYELGSGERLLKTLTVESAEQIDGYWIEKRLVMKNVQTGHSTTLIRSRIDLDPGLEKSDFSVRSLERGRSLR